MAVRRQAPLGEAVPLVLDPKLLPVAVLEEVRRSLRQDLEETLELVRHPRGVVRDPSSLDTAFDLLEGTLVLLDRPARRDRELLAKEANLAYAVLLAAIDLVKSHTDVPRVPAPRRTASPG